MTDLTWGQQQCINILDEPIAVAAGAGSGKTLTLTERIVHALEVGYIDDIGEVLAITFTNKAASELKSRIKAKLRARNMPEQALKVDDAWISTIHRMCARILRSHAVQLGIDPAFKVAQGAELKSYLTAAVEGVLLEAELAGGSLQIDALFAEYPARSVGKFQTSVESMLIRLVEAAVANPYREEAFVLPGVQEVDMSAIVRMLDRFEEQLEAAQAQNQVAKCVKWTTETRDALDAIYAATQEGSPDALQWFALLSKLSAPSGFGTKDFAAAQKELRLLLNETIGELRLQLARPHLVTLVNLAGDVLKRYRQRKQSEGVLDNNDLLVLAARAIEEHPDIAVRYVDRFKLVMVDEFQDTDQMQVDMIKRLAGEGFSRLCVVGDAQQSIYRFRGADVAVYRRHLEAVSAVNANGIIELPDNFRSHEDVLSFVDCVFGRPQMFGTAFMPLAHGRREAQVEHALAPDEPRITVQLTSQPSRAASGQMGNIAARRVAHAFANYARRGHSAGEMAVLLGVTTNAQEYAQAIRDEGLACVVSGGSVFAGTLEAQMVLELVRIAANPHETQSLYNVLAGPVFGLTATDFVQLCTTFSQEGKRPRKRKLDAGIAAYAHAFAVGDLTFDAASPQLGCAIQVLTALRENVLHNSVAHAVMDVVVQSGWLARMEEGGAEGHAAAANVHKAIRMLASLEKTRFAGPSALARIFAEELGASKEAPGALSTSGGDFVRIMTVHASKGLQFPIVAVAEFKDKSPSTDKLLVTGIGSKLYLSLDLGRTLDMLGGSAKAVDIASLTEGILGCDADEGQCASVAERAESAVARRVALRTYDAIGDAEEAKRLLYVALTRAEEALIVSAQSTYTKAEPNRLPGNVFAATITALIGDQGAPAPGRALCEFGGKAPAVVEHVRFGEAGATFDGTDELLAALAGPGATAPDHEGAPLFAVPAFDAAPRIDRVPFSMAHDGIFSYSSIAEASHEGQVLAHLADAYTVSVDGNGLAAEDEPASLSSKGALDGSESQWSESSIFRAWSPDDDDFWDGALAFEDADKATDLGTAFHRLAQYAVLARGSGGELVMPSDERVEALARICGLAGPARVRLHEALERWFGSQLAQDMGAMRNLHAEVPFFVHVGGHSTVQRNAIYLEGEIDLLGLSPDGRHACVVDYKTGGNTAEAREQLREKHVLQASCYAYALLKQGFDSVEAVFVRVEQPRAGDDDPQTVRYRFTFDDLADLEQSIAAVYAAARG